MQKKKFGFPETYFKFPYSTKFNPCHSNDKLTGYFLPELVYSVDVQWLKNETSKSDYVESKNRYNEWRSEPVKNQLWQAIFISRWLTYVQNCSYNSFYSRVFYDSITHTASWGKLLSWIVIGECEYGLRLFHSQVFKSNTITSDHDDNGIHLINSLSQHSCAG